jgi:hypothetical protein
LVSRRGNVRGDVSGDGKGGDGGQLVGREGGRECAGKGPSFVAVRGREAT